MDATKSIPFSVDAAFVCLFFKDIFRCGQGVGKGGSRFQERTYKFLDSTSVDVATGEEGWLDAFRDDV